MTVFKHFVNNDRFVVEGDKATYNTMMGRLGGRWSGKLKSGPAWTFPLTEKKPVMKFIRGIEKAERQRLKEEKEPVVEEKEPVVEEDSISVISKSSKSTRSRKSGYSSRSKKSIRSQRSSRRSSRRSSGRESISDVSDNISVQESDVKSTQSRISTQPSEVSEMSSIRSDKVKDYKFDLDEIVKDKFKTFAKLVDIQVIYHTTVKDYKEKLNKKV